MLVFHPRTWLPIRLSLVQWLSDIVPNASCRGGGLKSGLSEASKWGRAARWAVRSRVLYERAKGEARTGHNGCQEEGPNADLRSHRRLRKKGAWVAFRKTERSRPGAYFWLLEAAFASILKYERLMSAQGGRSNFVSLGNGRGGNWDRRVSRDCIWKGCVCPAETFGPHSKVHGDPLSEFKWGRQMWTD